VSYVFLTETTEDQRAWETVNKVIRLNEQFNYKKIGVDDGGPGFGVFSELMTEDQTKRKTPRSIMQADQQPRTERELKRFSKRRCILICR